MFFEMVFYLFEKKCISRGQSVVRQTANGHKDSRVLSKLDFKLQF